MAAAGLPDFLYQLRRGGGSGSFREAVQGKGVVGMNMVSLLGDVVVGVRPRLPFQKLLQAGKVLTSQAYNGSLASAYTIAALSSLFSA